MYFLLNFASIISFRLVTMDNKNDRCLIGKLGFLILVLMLLLVIIYVSFFFSEAGSNVIKCTEQERSKALSFMTGSILMDHLCHLFSSNRRNSKDEIRQHQRNSKVFERDGT